LELLAHFLANKNTFQLIPLFVMVLLFLTGTSSSSTLHLSTSIQTGQVFLKRFTIRGIPVTASVPDHDYYELSVEASGVTAAIPISNNGINSIPLPLTGSFTTEEFEGRGVLILQNVTRELGQLRVSICNPNSHDPATLTSFALWLEIC
jgi:hypothetical protein